MQKNILSALTAVVATLAASLAMSALFAVPANAAGLTDDALKNITLTSPDMTGDGRHTIVFKNGEHKDGEELDRILYTAVGDLNGDGIDDGAVVFFESGGGTGAFMQLAVFLTKDGKPVQIGERVLGDRSKTQKLFIKKKVITLDIFVHSPDDSASNPTLHKVLKFTVKNHKLMGTDAINEW